MGLVACQCSNDWDAKENVGQYWVWVLNVIFVNTASMFDETSRRLCSFEKSLSLLCIVNGCSYTASWRINFWWTRHYKGP